MEFSTIRLWLSGAELLDNNLDNSTDQQFICTQPVLAIILSLHFPMVFLPLVILSFLYPCFLPNKEIPQLLLSLSVLLHPFLNLVFLKQLLQHCWPCKISLPNRSPALSLINCEVWPFLA